MRTSATQKEVRAIIGTLTTSLPQSWCDRVPTSANERYLSFRFWDENEADKVAKKLRAKLVKRGFSNVVRRTSVDSNYETRTAGGEYVRLRVVFE